MSTGGLTDFLERTRSRPYQAGGLASVSVIAGMALFWIYFEIGAFVWLCLYPCWAGLDIFWKTPLRKTVSTALFLGTIVPLLVVFPMLFPSRQP